MTSHIHVTDDLFFNRTGMDPYSVLRSVKKSQAGMDDGELFLEASHAELLEFENGELKSAMTNFAQGFGLRAVRGEAIGYAHSTELTEVAIERAVRSVRAISDLTTGGTVGVPPQGIQRRHYTDIDPMSVMPFKSRLLLLGEVDAYARGLDSRVCQVKCTLSGQWRAIQILRADQAPVADIRPLVMMRVTVVAEHAGRREVGSQGGGGRFLYERFFDPAYWRAIVDEAVRRALVNLNSVPAPAGEMTVVLGSGWPAVMLHEAVGHGLEGDVNVRRTSAFTERLGQQVASRGVTVVDDGTQPDQRGSLTIDDEGTPTSRTALIEDGVLVGYMHDRLTARLMGFAATGNGRRQSFAHRPMPRMTNTQMMAGPHSPEEIIHSVKRGLYIPNMGGGQVEITSGKFVFAAAEAYMIEDGRLGRAVQGATLIGDGASAMLKIRLIGNDFNPDPGIATCGKRDGAEDQSVPVGVGQPTLCMEGMTVGGAAT